MANPSENSGQDADLDTVNDRVAIIALEVKFSGWLVYRGTEGLCHARHHQDHTHVTGEDWADLRDQLVRATGEPAPADPEGTNEHP